MHSQSENGWSSHDSGSHTVILFGDGACAHRIAANLAVVGVRVRRISGNRASPDASDASLEQPPESMELLRCRGFAGHFELLFNTGTASVTATASAIVVAEDPDQTPTFDDYGLQPGPGVVALSTLEDGLQHPESQSPVDLPCRIAFINGCHNESHPAVAKRMLDACWQLQERSGMATWYFTGNLKVAADGAESRVQQAKAAGTVFLTCSQSDPTIEFQAGKGFMISGTDDVLREPLRVQVDCLVVDETIAPTRHLLQLGHRLGIHSDAIGFAQADNVRRWSNRTNRRGIFVAGGGRGPLSADQQQADADQVSLQVLNFLKGLDEVPPAQVSIQRGRCVRCLTCHRLCPHMAIDVGPHVTIVPQACERCGICVAGCPARAIEMKGVSLGRDIHGRLSSPAAIPNHHAKPSQIVVLGCARSAGQAMELIRMTGQPLAQGVHWIEVPCGGAVAGRHLLEAFERGADGVMLCTCHTDNCQSEDGSRVARKRAAGVGELLTSAGVDARRLRIASVAANMGNEFANLIAAFADEMGGLGDG